MTGSRNGWLQTHSRSGAGTGGLGLPAATTGCCSEVPDLLSIRRHCLKAQQVQEHLLEQPGQGGWEGGPLNPTGFPEGGETFPHRVSG